MEILSPKRRIKRARIDDAPSECLTDLLWRQVRDRGTATAAVDERGAITFRQLAERSSEVGAYLRHLGVASDDCIGLLAEPSIDLIVGAWGILSSGGAYLPLSPEYPEDRLRYMVENVGAAIIVCQQGLERLVAHLAPHGTRIVTIEDAARFASSHGRPRRPQLRPGHLAYVIYTSGSTGRPKGVMIEHRSIVNQLQWLSAAHGLNETRSVLQKTPMSFDAAQWEILSPACGSRVVMGPPGIHRDPHRLFDTVVRHGVTTLQCVPTLLQALVDTDALDRCTSLTQVFSGGEALSKQLALRTLAALPGCGLVNLYGPTECTINSSSFTVDPRSVAEGPNVIPIGTPADNTQYHILDERRVAVAVGQIGELCIGGAQLARGYVGRPELTADRFIAHALGDGRRPARLYRTGDLASWNADGTVQFVGRADNQVKLRGCRIELDEVRLAIETHDWVKAAAVVVKTDARGRQNLVALVELNPREAPLMDQGNHGAHHQSKASRLQIRAQLANMGCRDGADLSGRPVVELPGREPTAKQRRRVFARKTYRFFEGGDVTQADILQLLDSRPVADGSRSPAALSFAELGEVLRYFGQYRSEERLLPKYGYASPGSLYAAQMYLESDGISGLGAGYYYYYPVEHRLVRLRDKTSAPAGRLRVHLVGRRNAVQPVYKHNIQEVLEIEAGHILGLFDEILPEYGLGIADLDPTPAVRRTLECPDEDHYLGSFELVPYPMAPRGGAVDLYVQAHPGRVADLPAGQYEYRDGVLRKMSDELVLARHVIAINQQVYQRASFGITAVRRDPDHWRSYVDLGRALQRLQMNDINVGLMSSGYSSKTGKDLPSAVRIESILRACSRPTGASYFFVGGRVSDEQIRGEGMKEDVVHMKGPAELIRDDLKNLLPGYMLPNRVIVLDELPLSANGKTDFKALERTHPALGERPVVPPRTRTEKRVAEIWAKWLNRDAVSMHDDFFESGGNSLTAVGLINEINREVRSSLALQVLFEAPTLERLVDRLTDDDATPPSRLVQLHADGSARPIYCWSGLGGYAMNLRLLAGRVQLDRPLYGVQAHGLNPGEVPYTSIAEMAGADVSAIRRLQPAGPYSLWGYSFGARVALETAHQLERAGAQVDHLFLIAPGFPKIPGAGGSHGPAPSFRDPAYVTLLYSVFAGRIGGAGLRECLRVARSEASFATFISERVTDLDRDLVMRIIRIVEQTYRFRYDGHTAVVPPIEAPITVFRAVADVPAFIETYHQQSAAPVTVITLEADHYGMLRQPGIGELVQQIRHRLRATDEKGSTNCRT